MKYEDTINKSNTQTQKCIMAVENKKNIYTYTQIDNNNNNNVKYKTVSVLFYPDPFCLDLIHQAANLVRWGRGNHPGSLGTP